MADPFVVLGGSLAPPDALKIASSLQIDGSTTKAVAKLPDGNAALENALRTCLERVGSSDLASILRGYAAAAGASATDLRPVWSGPTFDGDGDHTTAAVAHIIDEATEDLFASTYSATLGSPFVRALLRALNRGVAITLLVDPEVNNGETAALLRANFPGARVLQYGAGGNYARQHSKVLIVDSRIALITSANLSAAAAESNLEAGVIIRDPEFASAMRQRFVKLIGSGALSDMEEA